MLYIIVVLNPPALCAVFFLSFQLRPVRKNRRQKASLTIGLIT